MLVYYYVLSCIISLSLRLCQCACVLSSFLKFFSQGTAVTVTKLILRSEERREDIRLLWEDRKGIGNQMEAAQDQRYTPEISTCLTSKTGLDRSLLGLFF